MPLYHRHRLVHIHIPKTGGTPIEQAFMAIGDLSVGFDCLYGDQFRGNRWFELHHLTLDELAGRGIGDFDAYHRFASVRDPYQRLVSDYLWRRRIDRETPHPAIPTFDSFAEFIAAIPSDLDTEWDRHIAAADRARANVLIHVRPQHHYLRTADADLDPSVEVVRFEDFPAALEPILGCRGVPHDAITCTDDSRRRVADYFDDEVLAIVNRIYARDFELFGYPRIRRVIRL